MKNLTYKFTEAENRDALMPGFFYLVQYLDKGLENTRQVAVAVWREKRFLSDGGYPANGYFDYCRSCRFIGRATPQFHEKSETYKILGYSNVVAGWSEAEEDDYEEGF